MSSIEMSDAVIRSSRFTDQISEYEYIKIFARIRPQVDRESLDKSTEKGDAKEDIEGSRVPRDSKHPPKIANNNRLSQVRRETTPTKDLKRASPKVSQPQHRRVLSSPISRMSPLTSSNSPATRSNATTPDRSSGRKDSASSRLSSTTPDRSKKSIYSPSSRFSTTTPNSLRKESSSPFNSSNSDRARNNDLLSPQKHRIELSSSGSGARHLMNECEKSKYIPCVKVQGDKTLALIAAARCQCEACAGKTISLSASRSSSFDQSGLHSNSKTPKYFNFEKIFKETSSQDEVYNESVKNYVSTLFQGINSTVLAYGPPGSGKTFTMRGTKAAPGIVPRALADIFAQIAKAKSDCSRKEFKVEISFVELQNNQFRNLLREENKPSRPLLPCNEEIVDNEFSTWNAAAKRVQVNTEEDVLSAIDEALKVSKKRNSIGEEIVNRGHYVFTLYICTRINGSEGVYIPRDETFESFLNTCGDESEKITELLQARLHFVELASSDRVSTTRTQRLKELDSGTAETHHVNLSLLAFGEVLTRLAINAVTELKLQQQKMSASNDHMPFLRSDDFIASTGSSECDEKRSMDSFDGLRKAHNPLAAHNNWATQLVHSATTRSDRSSKKLSDPSKQLASTSSSSPSRQRSADNQDNSLRMLHVPYMDSKLTLLLRDSLGGNSRTVMITTLSPEAENYTQNLYALSLAIKASKVLNKPTSNWSKIVERASSYVPVTRESKLISHLKATYLDNSPDHPPSPVSRVKKTKKSPEPIQSPVAAITKSYKVTIEDIIITNMEAGKKRKVFPIYTSLKLGICENQFQSTRQCQKKSVTKFSEKFEFVMSDEALQTGSVISLDVAVDGFNHPDCASGVLVLNKSAYQANYSAMTGVSSLTLSTKLTWMDDFISRTTSENRPVFSCRISILEESKERKDEFFPETSKSECLHMENDLRIILKEKMKAEHRKAVEMSFERKDFPSQCFDKQEVLCLTIRSVSVGRLSCLELLGNQVRNRGKDSSKRLFFILQMGGFWKLWSQIILFSSRYLSSNCTWDNLQLTLYPTREEALIHKIEVLVFCREFESVSEAMVDTFIGSAQISVPATVTGSAPLFEKSSTPLKHPTQDNKEMISIDYEIKVAEGERWFKGKIFNCTSISKAPCNSNDKSLARDTYEIMYDNDNVLEDNVPSDMIRLGNINNLLGGRKQLANGDEVFVKSDYMIQEELKKAEQEKALMQERMRQTLSEYDKELAIVKQANSILGNNLQSSKEKINELQKILTSTKAKLLEEAKSRARAHELATALHKAKAKIEVHIERLPSDDPFDTVEIMMAEKGRLEGERQAQLVKAKREEKERELLELTNERTKDEKLFTSLNAEENLEERLMLRKTALDIARKEKVVLSTLLEHALEETKLLVAAKSKAEVEAREREDIKAREARKKLAAQLLDGEQNPLKQAPPSVRSQYRQLREVYDKLSEESIDERTKYAEAKDKLCCIQSDAQNLICISSAIEKQFLEMQQIEIRRQAKLSSSSAESQKQRSYDGSIAAPDPFDIYQEKGFHVYMDETEAEMFGMINHKNNPISASASSEYLDEIYHDKEKDPRYTYYNEKTKSFATESLVRSNSMMNLSVSMDPLAPLEHSRSAYLGKSTEMDTELVNSDVALSLSPYGTKEKAILRSLSTASKSWAGGVALDGGQAEDKVRQATSEREACDKAIIIKGNSRERADNALKLVIEGGTISDIPKAVETVISATAAVNNELSTAVQKLEVEINAVRTARNINEEAMKYVAEGVVKYAQKSLKSKAVFFKRHKQTLKARKDQLSEDWNEVVQVKATLRMLTRSSSSDTPDISPTTTVADIKREETVSFEKQRLKLKLRDITSQGKQSDQRKAVESMFFTCKRSIGQLHAISERIQEEINSKDLLLNDIRSRREAEDTRLDELSLSRADEEAAAKTAAQDGDMIEQARALCSAYSYIGREYTSLTAAGLLTLEESELVSTIHMLQIEMSQCMKEERIRRSALVTLQATLANYGVYQDTSSSSSRKSVGSSSRTSSGGGSRRNSDAGLQPEASSTNKSDERKSIGSSNRQNSDSSIKIEDRKIGRSFSGEVSVKVPVKKEEKGPMGSASTELLPRRSRGRESFGKILAASRSDSGKCIPRKKSTSASMSASHSTSSDYIRIDKSRSIGCADNDSAAEYISSESKQASFDEIIPNIKNCEDSRSLPSQDPDPTIEQECLSKPLQSDNNSSDATTLIAEDEIPAKPVAEVVELSDHSKFSFEYKEAEPLRPVELPVIPEVAEQKESYETSVIPDDIDLACPNEPSDEIVILIPDSELTGSVPAVPVDHVVPVLDAQNIHISPTRSVVTLSSSEILSEIEPSIAVENTIKSIDSNSEDVPTLNSSSPVSTLLGEASSSCSSISNSISNSGSTEDRMSASEEAKESHISLPIENSSSEGDDCLSNDSVSVPVPSTSMFAVTKLSISDRYLTNITRNSARSQESTPSLSLSNSGSLKGNIKGVAFKGTNFTQKSAEKERLKKSSPKKASPKRPSPEWTKVGMNRNIEEKEALSLETAIKDTSPGAKKSKESISPPRNANNTLKIGKPSPVRKDKQVEKMIFPTRKLPTNKILLPKKLVVFQVRNDDSTSGREVQMKSGIPKKYMPAIEVENFPVDSFSMPLSPNSPPFPSPTRKAFSNEFPDIEKRIQSSKDVLKELSAIKM